MTGLLTLEEPIPTLADVFHCFSEKIRHDILRESSARQRIHKKYHAILSSED